MAKTKTSKSGKGALEPLRQQGSREAAIERVVAQIESIK